MANKRSKKRLERRRHHQHAQEDQRRERRRQVEEAVAATTGAFKDLEQSAADETVTPPQFADQLSKLLDLEYCESMLADPVFSSDFGAALVDQIGAERATYLRIELASRIASEIRLAWFAVGLAEGADDLKEAALIASSTLVRLTDVDVRPDAIALLARLWLESERLADCLDLLDDACRDAPADDELQRLRARALYRARFLYGLDQPGAIEAAAPNAPTTPDPNELVRLGQSFEHFSDRSLLYALRGAVERFIVEDPELADWRADFVASFEQEAREIGGLGPFDKLGDDPGNLPDSGIDPSDKVGGDAPEVVAGYGRLAAERAWLGGPDRSDDEDLSDDETILGRFAADQKTPRPLAEAARSWLALVRYGLWQVTAPAESGPGGGVWLADLVTRRAVFAALAEEQLEGLARWSVLAGALGPIAGVWRSGGSFVVLDPDLADRAAENALESAQSVVSALAREHGIRAPHAHRRRSEPPRPHGVLAELAPPMHAFEANLTGKVLSNLLPSVIGTLEGSRRTGPALHNTDGDPLEMLSVTFAVADPHSVRSRLLKEADLEEHDAESDEGEIAAPLHLLGREMSASEAAGALAQFRNEAKRRGWGSIETPTGPQRYLRGGIHFEPGQLRVEVNSRRRLALVTAMLQRAGISAEPRITKQFDPSLDLPIGAGRLRPGRGGLDPDAEAVWRSHWIDERVPALGGATPRAASQDQKGRVLLESLLRSFEYGADLTAVEGGRGTDVDWIRAELGMTDGVFGVSVDEELEVVLEDADDDDELS